MTIRKAVSKALILLVFLCGPTSLSAQAFWTDWTAANSGTVSGSLSVFSQAIEVTYTGPYAWTQTAGGAYNWDFPIYDVAGPGTRPATSDLIALIAPGLHTLTFSAPVVDPFIAIMSLGRTYLPVSYSFSDPFTLLTEGRGWWGDGWFNVSPDNRVLTGYEGHGVVQFSGTFSTLSWYSDPAENWHGITMGVADAGSVVPEPGTILLLATGLLGIGGVARWRRRDEEV